MQQWIRRLPWQRPTSTQQIVPPELRPRFYHLYWDIAWFGLVAGTTLAFQGVYAARIGATAFEISLLTAGPALINLLLTLPAGQWLQSRPLGRSVLQTALATRGIYLVYALLPFLLPETVQMQTLIVATLLFTVPGVALAIGFNALFATAVPLEWRSYVAGRRNAVLAVVYVVTSLAAGYVLQITSLAVGYTVVFGVGFLGAAMSFYHLAQLRDVRDRPEDAPPRVRQIIGDAAQPGSVRGGQGVGQRIGLAPRIFTRGRTLMRTDIVQGHYGWVIVALFCFHLAQFMPLALFPLRWVDQLAFSDFEISIGTATFHGFVLFGSLQLDQWVRRFGSHKITVAGTALLAIYPLLTAYMPDLWWYLFTSVLGGLAWALVGGALPTYLFEQVPQDDRPAYLAWYNLALNAAVLFGVLLGPLLADWFDLQIALVLSFVFRFASALVMWAVERNQTHPLPTTSAR